MGDVIELGVSGEEGDAGAAVIRSWVCLCGCSTFEMFDDGTCRCANCEQYSHHEYGGWYRPDADDGAEQPSKRVVGADGSDEFLRQRVSRLVLDEEVIGALVIRESGELTFMETAVSKRQVKWFMRRLDAAKRMLGRG